MPATDLSSEFRGKAFLMYLPPRGQNPLSTNARLVFSYLVYRRSFKKGSSLAKIGEFLGMSPHHGVRSAIEELRSHKLVGRGDGYQWFAPEGRPDFFAGRGFIAVYMLRESKGGRLTNTDNLMLWVLRHLQLPQVKWKWPRHRSSVLANFLGIEPRNVKRHIRKLQSMNLVTADWRVNTVAIDPDWYRTPKEDEASEPYIPMPETGNRWADEFLMHLQLGAEDRSIDRAALRDLLVGLIRTGCLSELSNSMQLMRAKDRLRKCSDWDVETLRTAILEAIPSPNRQAPPESSSPQPVKTDHSPIDDEPSVPIGDAGFSPLDLDALSNGSQDIEFTEWCAEGSDGDLDWLDKFTDDATPPPIERGHHQLRGGVHQLRASTSTN